MTRTSDVVVFAIRAGIRLYGAGKKAYVEATLGRPLILPLPSGPNVDAASAVNFFSTDRQGQRIAALPENERIRELLAVDSTDVLTDEQDEEITRIYQAYLRELKPSLFADDPDPDAPKGAEMVAIMTVRQWSEEEPAAQHGALRTVAGTLVNVAVDYFVQVPGAISEHRPTGKALKAFLEAVDDLDFAQTPPADVAGEILVSVIDSVAANPDLISDSESGKALVKNITTTLSLSANAHLREVPSEQRWQGSAWLQIAARAFIKGGADTVLADPRAVLGVDEDEGKFIQTVGGTIAELVIGPDADERLRFQALLSGDGLNKVIKSALQATSVNPGVLGVDNEGFRKIVVGVADGLSSQSNLLTSDIFPELLELVLLETAENLELVWPGEASDPGQHILLTGTRQLFVALAESTEGTSPVLTKGQLLEIAEAAFEEIVDNPDWVVEKTELESRPALEVAVRAALASLRDHPGPRLDADATVRALNAALKAASARLELLEKLPPGGQDAGKVALSAAIDAVFESAFGDSASAEQHWARARSGVMSTVLEVALEQLARIGAEQQRIDVLRAEIGGLVDERLEPAEFAERLLPLLEAA